MADYPIHILLVEDDEIDVEIVQRAFQQQKISHPIVHARDGVEALQMLRGEGNHPWLPQPYLILLDMNMPRMNGIEFLQTLRQDSTLRQSIVFILTTSAQEEDKIVAYNEQIAGYFLKSTSTEVLGVVNLLAIYAQLIEFPPQSSYFHYSQGEHHDANLNCA